MKIDTENTTVTESNAVDVEEVEMRFSEDALPHLTQMFVSLYNNPEEAVYREVLFNAIDATKDSELDKPVSVYLPTVETPVLTITDFGIGMSVETMKTIYSQFGESTKRGDNDSVGGFGLGSKSPLSITPQFTVESIKDGNRTVATISKSDDGICRMSILLQDTVDQPNGTSVSIPVRDSNAFRKIAENYSTYIPQVVKYYNTRSTNWSEKTFYEQEHYTSFTKIFDGLYLNKVVRDFSSITFVMGGVPYNVSLDDLGFHIPELANVFSYRFIYELPIGSVKLSPNREGIQFTKKTKDTIKNSLYNKLSEINNKLDDSIKNAKTFREAREAFANNSSKYFHSMTDYSWNDTPLVVEKHFFPMINTKDYGRGTQQFMHQVDAFDGALKKDGIQVFSDRKILFVDPSDTVSNSRTTFLIRRYFEKNSLDWSKYTVYRTNKPTSEYTLTTYPDLSDTDVFEKLDKYGTEYEVISIEDIKKDIGDWKPVSEKVVENKPKIKYLDKEYSFLHVVDGKISVSQQKLSDIMGDGEKTFALYEYKSRKNKPSYLSGVSEEVFLEYFKNRNNIDSIDGIITLENNSKSEVLENNTKKFKNKYVKIEDLFSIKEFGQVLKVEKLLSMKPKMSSFFNSRYDYYLKNFKNINDPYFTELMDSGSRELLPDEVSDLKNINLSSSSSYLDTVVTFLESVCKDITPESMRRTLEYSYYSIWTAISVIVEADFLDHMKKYPLANLNYAGETIEYMNYVFDSKYSS